MHREACWAGCLLDEKNKYMERQKLKITGNTCFHGKDYKNSSSTATVKGFGNFCQVKALVYSMADSYSFVKGTKLKLKGHKHKK